MKVRNISEEHKPQGAGAQDAALRGVRTVAPSQLKPSGMPTPQKVEYRIF